MAAVDQLADLRALERGDPVQAFRSFARFGPYARGEHGYANELWPEVPDRSLPIVDRGFLVAGVLIPPVRAGQDRHWLTQAKKNTSWRVVKRLGPKDQLVEMEVSHQAREKDPTLPKIFLARAIRNQRKGFLQQTLLTSLLDADRYPAAEMASDEWLWCAVASPGAIPKRLRNLRAKLARLIPPPRRERSYPRAVNVKMSSYPRMRPKLKRKAAK